MQIRLSRIQRALLLLASLVVALTTFNQLSYNGFDGYGWVLAALVALALAFVAVAPAPGTSANGEARPSVTTRALARDLRAQLAAIEEASVDADQLHLQTMSEEAVRIKGLIFGYVLVSMLCRKQDVSFWRSDRENQLRASFRGLLERCAARTFRVSDSQFVGAGGLGARNFVDGRYQAALSMEDAVTSLMDAGSRLPFQPLYEFIEGALGSQPSPEKIELKYSPITRALLTRLDR